MLGHTRYLTIGLLSALLMAGSALAEPEVTQLGTATGADPLTQCGDLAASRWEPGRDGRGVEDDQVFIDGALAACEAALADNPDSTEAMTWLARVYILAGRREDAKPLLQAAAEAGSAFAPYLLHRIDGILGMLGDPSQAPDLLAMAVDRGFAPAQSDLAERYETEGGDIFEAHRLFQLAADQGHAYATLKLGMYARYGWVAEVDYAAAADLYQRAIDLGEPKAYFELGQLYEQGQGFAQDYLRAAELYQQGADLGDEWSQTQLAYLYEYGLGVTKDFDKSFTLLRAAEPSGYGYALAALSLHYMLGQGTEIDNDRAYELAWAAQRKNIVYAEGLLGYLFQYGLGTVRDLSSALFHYQEGSTKGDQYSTDQIPNIEALLACQDAAGSPYEPGGTGRGLAFDLIDPEVAIPACENATAIDSYAIGNFVWLARAYARAERYQDAVPLLEQGIADGNVLAHVVMGDLLMAGAGVDQDPARAVSLYEAVAKDFGLAQYSLGVAYRLGIGVPEDREQALHWLRMAQSFGVIEADAEINGILAEADSNAIDLSGFGREGPGY
jgi:TPR repeat protein